MLSIMLIGDIVGKPGRDILKKELPALLRQHRPDMIIANGENAAAGRGVTERIVQDLFHLGIDVITLGNHTWDNREVFQVIDQELRVIRPANYPPGVPGRGWVMHEIRPGVRPVAVINLMGRTFMSPIDCPFQAADQLLQEINEGRPEQQQAIVIVDFHAEATSEKETMGFYLAGKAAAVLGTHTHVQTADERVLPGGTAYITDLGMTGTRDSILGIQADIMIRRFTTQMPVRHELAEGPCIINGVMLEIDEKVGKAVSITRINEYYT